MNTATAKLNPILCVLLLIIGCNISADDSILSNECKVLDKTNAVIIMVCPRYYGKEAWKSAGEDACDSVEFCNVWIWDDVKKAPSTAPNTDAGIPKNNTAKAVAIWINDSKSLVSLVNK